ncbi:glycosyltransferase [Campylobacter hepaticus]|uniref:Glycosyltransferase n=1 Tax=Campylobacter hepaticus TaxID=1813019 RepID=A0A6A7JRE0_9BACT|nr:glycosyltransferase [Campylobacter hepaticus]AXP08387.1 glycosyltransferase family 4 protein [Campylobacter hepaticus]MCZ0772216.1 glycosyltransferase [Campylobacter hepaticus]MCZ0773684.1 glycosyltransferase [Campylobacter hepaticus]MCZ0774935.1 glycosyltransferase [Campylobacter hepaticus]MDX2322803.1 glycosyltransferase [Campylobacter hepaticus]
MMKISFIIATLNSGGAERVLVTLANAFCKEHEVSIIKFHPENSFYKLEENIKIITLKQFRFDSLYHKIFSRFKKIFALRKALKESEADIFISFLDTTNIACIVASLGLKIPLIICEHSNKAYLKSKIWYFLRRISYPFCDALTVLGNDDKKYYEKFVKNVRVLLNPCHFSDAVFLDSDLKKENLVLFIGRLDQNKNPAMFLKAIAHLDKILQESCEFIVVGDGQLKQELEYKAKSLKIRVKFLGHIENVQVLYERAKILCLCSFMEGLPTVLIESLYFEVCRISSTYYSGAKDLIRHDYDGFLVACDDEIALAKKIEFVLKNEYLRKKIVLNAKKRCKDFEILNIKNQWLELINEVKNA